MALKSNALTTLARTKTALGITNSSKDSLLELYINAISDYIQNVYLGRTLKRTAFSNETYDGKGTPRFALKHYPVDSAETQSVEILFGSFDNGSWDGVDTDTFEIEPKSGVVKGLGGESFNLAGAFFPKGSRNVRVSYTAGYYLPQSSEYENGAISDDLKLPGDIEMVVWEMVQMKMNTRKSAGVKSERVRDVAITYGGLLEQSSDLKMILDQYKRRAYG